ncbi:MAG: polymer-forming cytoskeletal protein [Lachnospiraceae bacterium]|nr:polymer-forming cytoskeletal protein [Lachnospiraceae bacterium]
MFTSKKKTDTVNTGMISTIIGNNSKIEGVLSASDPTRIDGYLKGEVQSESSVIVGEHGVVKGDIRAVEILVAGTVYGNLKAESRIELTETGCVLGDMVTKRLVIDEGASFKGNCTMEILGREEEEEEKQPPVREQEKTQDSGKQTGKQHSENEGHEEK